MFVNPRERLTFQADLRDTRVIGRTIGVVIPTLTDTSFDAEHDSAVDPSSGTGLGRTATYAISNLYANIRTVDESLKTFGQTPPGAQIGETFITINKRDYDTLLACLNNKDAYLMVDGSPFRPKAIEIAGVGQTEEYVVSLVSFNPLFRAAGY